MYSQVSFNITEFDYHSIAHLSLHKCAETSLHPSSISLDVSLVVFLIQRAIHPPESLNALTFSRIYTFSHTLFVFAPRRALLDNVIRITFPANEAIDLSPRVPFSLPPWPPRVQASQTNHRNLLKVFFCSTLSRSTI